jgi:hypothetical protein
MISSKVQKARPHGGQTGNAETNRQILAQKTNSFRHTAVPPESQ